MGNSPSPNNYTGEVRTEQTIKEEIKKRIRQDCQRYAINGEIGFENFQDILGIFSDYGLIHLRKSPLARLIFKQLDKNLTSKIPVMEAADNLTKLVDLTSDQAIQYSFFLISKYQTFLTKE